MSEFVLDIVMPIQEGRFIPQEVLSGILHQGVPSRLWVSTRFSNRDYADARNQVKQFGKSKFVLMLDNDIVLPPDSLKRMVDFLDSRPDFGAIGLCKHKRFTYSTDEAWLRPAHVDMSCVLFRLEVLQQITFVDHANAARLGRKVFGCECAGVCHDMKRMGLGIGFLPRVYVDHLHNESVLPSSERSSPA